MPCTVIQATTAKVDAYATVIVDKNRYSVPTLYTGLKVQVHLAVACLEIFYNGKKLATHPRLFSNNKWQLNPDHYLELIQQRPGAFHSARPLRRWRETWPSSLEKLLGRFQESQGETAGIKDFISVLMLYREHSREEIQTAVELALVHNLSSSPGVKHLLHKSEPGHPPLQQWPATLIPDVSVYGQLGGVS
jgi:Mu transposase, C-terminal domain